MLLVASRVRMIPGIRLSTDTDYLWNTSTINIVLLLLLLLLFFFFLLMGKEECTSKSPTRQMRAKPAAVDCDLPVAESRYHQCHRAADDLLTDYF